MKLCISLFIVFLVTSFQLLAKKTSSEKIELTPQPLSKISFNEKEFKKSKSSKELADAIVYLDVDGVAPSIVLEKASNKLEDLDELTFDSPLNFHAFSSQLKVPLKGIKKGLYYLRLPVGIYQITELNAPYYNLPYKVDTEKDPRWRFRVYPKSYTYIGHLKIVKDRTRDFVEAYFLDRFYADQEAIDEATKNINDDFTVRHGVQIYTSFEQTK